MSLAPAPLAPHPAAEWYDEVPRSIRGHAKFGIALMVCAFGGFGVWAFQAPLAAAVISQGSFVATGQNKIVQHLEGGIIREILVAEGDRVRTGTPILRLDETAALANERELFLREVRLEATEARLLAEHDGAATVTMPDRLVIAAATDPEVEAIIASQRLNFREARRALEQDVALIERNIEALQIRAGGYRLQLDSHERQLAILGEEQASQQQLLEKGLVRRTQINVIDRTIAEAEGQIGRLEAEIEEIEMVQSRHRTQIDQARSEHRQVALEELQAIQAELDSVREKSRTARNILRRAVVEAPVDGTIVRLLYNTPGGVIESGKPIAEILPTGAPLIVEAKISRNEIDSVELGQIAAVRLVALNQRTTPILEGHVVYVSADAISEKVEGSTLDIYVARIALDGEELSRVSGFTPTPGMPAEVMIQTAERTFAQYLAKPISDSMWRAFKEE
ncbi:HlyD family type I secretion periplasmic adaptor subunit [Jannaschia sp. W003]|uniref:HlyD family type I secretion periplasmic adaptor subunit n=1 Tax=Jannaschia sp. W003 TaxID=2867012 RepID=UPI0021A61514|nr:HlyD family type I secretion periplasmic adaptor subunit [Jannaschia sp. W003]UWQ22430.1 HlyD family type I secretion periplasmic adaptor subunit [Jannaschia sp. W003]